MNIKYTKYNGVGIPYLEIDGAKYPIHFHHDMDHVDNAIFSEDRIKGVTEAIIKLPTKEITTQAYCSVNDTYCRQKGRIVAYGKLYAKLLKMEKYHE